MKKRILLHDQKYNIGGPKAVLNNILHSHLSDKYDFQIIEQVDSCGFNPIKAIKALYNCKKTIDNYHADAIYICGLQYSGFLMTLAAKLSNVKKIVLSVHGSDWDNPNRSIRKKILMYIIEPLEIWLADEVITVCDAAREIIKPLRKLKRTITTIYNTFPNISYEDVPSLCLRRELNIASSQIIVVSVGRVVEAKGHNEIIEVILNNKDRDFTYVIVGDGPYLEEYKRRCSDAINERRLHLLGKRNDVNSILKDSDIFLFPTHNENHSIALMEAINMKCAVIATNVGGNPEVILDSVSGFLVSKMNSVQIIDSLNTLKDSSLRSSFTYHAYNYAKNKFSINNTLNRLDTIFSDEKY